MITQYPQSEMPEPYRTYVRQRSHAIADALVSTVGENTNVQLCPRAIMPEERLFKTDDAIVYGVVVGDQQHGLKSVLYEGATGSRGIKASTFHEAEAYAADEFERGNRIRLKEPDESDGKGQHIVANLAELHAIFDDVAITKDYGVVLMPHLDSILERVSIGVIALKHAGIYAYVGRENAVEHNGSEVYGGTSLGLCCTTRKEGVIDIIKKLEIPPALLVLGMRALNEYYSRVIEAGRYSVDVLSGLTDNGESVSEVVDITPRVGGATPAEVLAIAEVKNDRQSLCYAKSRLLYNPKKVPLRGTNFINTESLVINAEVTEVAA